MAKDATELYAEMHNALQYGYLRKSADPLSPCQDEVVEAPFGCSFTLRDISKNIPGQRPTDVRWAVANTLHFFSGVEHAAVLRKYNKRAERFLTGDLWKGAYGAVAMPQLRACVELLKADPQSRRAIVSMGDCLTQDINRPACWSTLHLLQQAGALHMLCYQRSLNLYGVMPYDCVALTNVLNWAAWKLGTYAGALYWHFGSLHDKRSTSALRAAESTSCLLPPWALDDPQLCCEWLCEPTEAAQPWSEILIGGLTT